MSDEKKPDAPAKPLDWRRVVEWVAILAISAVIARLTGTQPVIPPFPQQPVNPPSFGWLGGDAEEAEIQRAGGVLEFSQTPAGQVVMGEQMPDHAYLWQAVRKCWQIDPLKDSRDYPHEDQRDVGSCVGNGTKHAADASLASEVLAAGADPQVWEPFSVEAIYAAGRIRAGKIGRWDGSTGPWSAAALIEDGLAPMRKYGSTDLSRYNRYRSREWVMSGIPEPVRAEAARHKAAGVARIRSYDELIKAASQGYGAFICSQVGFESKKDKDGFQRPQGYWPHCMAVIGFQTARPGLLVLNSWSPEHFHTGPRGAGEPPGGSFWVDRSFAEKWISSNDTYCYAVSGIAGFEARNPQKLDWIIRDIRPINQGNRPAHILGRFFRCDF